MKKLIVLISINLISLLSVIYLHSSIEIPSESAVVIVLIYLMDVSFLLVALVSLRTEWNDYSIRISKFPDVLKLLPVAFVIIFTLKFTDLDGLSAYTFGVIVFLILVLMSTFIKSEKPT